MQQHLICQLIPFPDPMTASEDASGASLRGASGSSSSKMTVIHHHHQIRREQQQRLPLPPPPPMVRPRSSLSSDPPIFTSLAASTLPRNFWHQQRGQRHMPRPLSVTIRRPPRSLVMSSEAAGGQPVQLPSPPDPPASFALSALVSFICHAKRPLQSPPPCYWFLYGNCF